ncbi:MAG TPA: tyrosine--tRNA ligase [Vicinamibacterales bacterium]|nr:tyrosine--tRNA ligase [Vicinamibacterales bacterium]
MNLFDELKWRGLVYDATEGLADVFDRERVTAYIGFDPTASSLHIGNLLGLVTLSRLQRDGHSPIAIAGGGTGMIGDPSGKAQERTLLTLDQINANLDGIRPQLAKFLDFDRPDNPARVVNNADWLAKFDLLGFLRDTGKYFTVNYMLQKESVHRRLESEDGISYTEFSYLLLQSRDFLELFDRYGCTLQMGGSDQWGNITAGIELIRKARAAKAHGLVTPLVTTASGTKFGKTEAGTIWLDPARTRQSEFRNFWLNTDDRDVVTYLKYFTFLSRAEIDDLDARTSSEPGKREAQRVLAASVTTLVHGSEGASRAESVNAALFGVTTSSGGFEDAARAADGLLAIAGEVPSASMPASDFDGGGMSVVDVVARVTAVSKSEARRLVQQGGVSVNDRKISDVNARLVRADALDGRVFLLGKGSRQRFVLRLT